VCIDLLKYVRGYFGTQPVAALLYRRILGRQVNWKGFLMEAAVF
jgi:hypothetical protein